MKIESLDQLKSAVSSLWEKVFGKTEADAVQNDTPEGVAERIVKLEGAVANHVQLTADLATAKQTIGTLTAEKTALTGQVTQLTTDLTAANTKVTTLEGQVATLEGTIKDPKGEIAKQVRSICASQGINVDQLPSGQGAEGGADPKAKAQKEYMKLIGEGKSLEAGKFWQENKELLS